jgi:hypothetical protein
MWFVGVLIWAFAMMPVQTGSSVKIMVFNCVYRVIPVCKYVINTALAQAKNTDRRNVNTTTRVNILVTVKQVTEEVKGLSITKIPLLSVRNTNALTITNVHLCWTAVTPTPSVRIYWAASRVLATRGTMEMACFAFVIQDY